MPTAPPTDELPARFRVAKRTLWFDQFMTGFIKVGGVLVIMAVAGIFVFILAQILPLFHGARVAEEKSVRAGTAALLAVDEWAELPVLVAPDGALTFIDAVHGAEPRRVVPQFEEARTITAVAYRQQRVIVGTTDGRFALVPLNYSMSGGRVSADPQPGPFYGIGPDGARIVQLDYADSGDDKLAAAICEVNGRREVHAATLEQKRSLLGKGKVEVGAHFNLTAELGGAAERVIVSSNADGLLVGTTGGEVDYFFRTGDRMALRQRFSPFAGRRIATMSFILGDVSVSFTSESGENVVFSLFVPDGGNDRLWGQTKTFRNLDGAPVAFAASQRNKTFFVASETTASLRHSTTESIRWEAKLPFAISRAVISGKNDRLMLLDAAGTLHFFSLDDPHPEASWRAFFGRIWYEGASKPKYEWQSAGGTDDVEPKLSLVPLIVGTLKGTLYAMLFALPIALLAALYAAVFLDPRMKRYVKPVMEIMASLPSVVLGFIAALWLAPLIEKRIPSILAIAVLVPVSALIFGWVWAGLPYEKRRCIRHGYEFFVFAPIVVLVAWMGWHLGPVIERSLFAFVDPATGLVVADFRQWWPHVTGADFQQRNSLVVGFVMGFAVIPIIFTIAEDALSNVPPSLSSASLALGASRWQTAINIVLPTASAGIFSAVMIGLGRAVGETMIVVMATGNTPIMDLNIFSGMRTLAANIAVELPEAPHHGTLYRTLFLGAMLLFVMTFAVNTVAEVLRQRLREKFKTV
ncbi:MAG: ABC transporter permease subunit [Chthoniobacteraceae bacterium]